jgi:hypothetical protein
VEAGRRRLGRHNQALFGAAWFAIGRDHEIQRRDSLEEAIAWPVETQICLL